MFSSSLESSATSGVRHPHDLVADRCVDGDRGVGARVGQAADHLRRVAQRVVRAAGIDALRREGQREVGPGLQPRLLQQRHEVLARRAREGRGLEHDRLPTADHARQRARGAQQRPEIRLAVAGQRRRDADEDRVGLVQLHVAGREHAALEHGAQPRVGDVLDVRAALAQGRDLARVDVEPDHVAVGLREGDREREADVAETDDPDLHRESSSRSERTIMRISSSNVVLGSQPSTSLALVASPTSRSTSAGRRNCGSRRT